MTRRSGDDATVALGKGARASSRGTAATSEGPDEPALPAATMLDGRYQVIDLLGKGGMGEVYRARDPRLNRFVAIKIVLSGTRVTAERRDRHAEERRCDQRQGQ